MNEIASSCSKCEAALPAGASFCPECGTATPTGIRKSTGVVAEPETTDTSEAEFRDRLQDALGDAYELRELIGRGGFGVVYAAWDVNLKREVAVKAIRFDLLHTESLMERFRREAESVAQLRHPNVVPIYTIGQAEGFAYFTMPRLIGTNLADLFDGDTQLSVREAHRIFRELSGALAAAHRAGIIHRDIKPENVFLEDPERRALLMDFGIAKTEDDAEAGKLTGTGMIVGTPHYMSPEQAAGERHIDHRSDMYSLGVVAYQLFSGKTPFKETSSQKIIVERLTTVPEDLAISNPAVPEEIAAAVMRCLEREPDDRWNSMVNLISVLDTVEVPEDEDAELLLAGATPIEPPTKRGWMGLVAGGLGLMLGWLATYGQHSAPAVDDPAVSRSEAERIAADYLVNADSGGSFATEMLAGDLTRTTAYNRASDDTRTFLVRTLGFDGAANRAKEDLPISDWSMRWRESDGTRRWDVRVGSDGKIKEFNVHLDDDEPGARLDEDDARVIADAFLLSHQWDPAALELRVASSQRQPQRTEHFFTYRDRSHAIPWTADDGSIDSAFLELNVDVSGDRVTRYRRVLQRPDGFDVPGLSNAAGIGVGLISLLGIVYGFGLVLAPKRRRFVRWKPAVNVTVVVLMSAAVGWMSSLPDQVHTSSSVSMGAYLLSDGFNDLLGLLVIGVGLVMLAMGALALARDVFPAHVAEWENVFSGRFRLPSLGQSVLVGYLAGFTMIAVGDLTTVVLWPLRRGTFSGEPGYLEHATELMPFLGVAFSSLAVGIPMALAALFVVSQGRHLFKSTAAAVAAPLLLILVVTIPFILNGDTSPIGAVLVIAVLTVTVVRFGVVAGAIAGMLQAAEPGLHMLASGIQPFVLSGAVGWFLVLLPGLLVAGIHVRQRKAA